jgi:hypothetical protein
MSNPIHARPEVCKQIERACETDNVTMNASTQHYIIQRGLSRRSLFDALSRHVRERREVHAKFHEDGTHSYHGSLELDTDSGETVYFEVKVGDELKQKIGSEVVAEDGIYLRVKPHDVGRNPLARRIK